MKIIFSMLLWLHLEALSCRKFSLVTQPPKTHAKKGSQWQIQGCTGIPLWTTPSTKKYTDVRPNGTPLSGYRAKKTAATAHLRML